MNRIFVAGLCAITLMLYGQSAFAATRTITFSGTTLDFYDDTGGTLGAPLTGQPTGFFSFDDSLVTNIGSEVVDITDFTDAAFLFGGLDLSLADLLSTVDTGEITLQDGVLSVLEYNNSSLFGAYNISLFYDVANVPAFNTWSIDNSFTFDSASGELTASETVVPIPAAVWLFGSGLLGLVGVARRKKTV